MRIAYLVLTHAMPDHLGRQIAALADSGTDFYVHVDRKVPIEPFLQHGAANVVFLERRVPVYWGQWQMVEATLRLIKLAFDRGRDYDYLVLLSGSCYPIRSRAHIQDVLAAHVGDQFINSVAMPHLALSKPLSRLDRFYVRSDQSRMENLRRAVRGAATLRRAGRPFSKRWLLASDWRSALGSMTPHGGSSWWALTGEACRYIDAFVDREPRVIHFFENTRSPDETLFQTILANSLYAARMRRGLTFSDWSARGSHPALITEQHVARFGQPGPMILDGVYGRGEMCFARKFPDDGGRMTRLVDEMVERWEAGS
jgi:hypothetical protein